MKPESWYWLIKVCLGGRHCARLCLVCKDSVDLGLHLVGHGVCRAGSWRNLGFAGGQNRQIRGWGGDKVFQNFPFVYVTHESHLTDDLLLHFLLSCLLHLKCPSLEKLRHFARQFQGAFSAYLPSACHTEAIFGLYGDSPWLLSL